MLCPACGHANPDGARFCGGCGAPVARALACSGCGQESPAGQRFCHGCGASLAGAPAPAPRAYTPKHLADKILTSRSALEGERKQVTVLFVDVARSQEIAGSVDAEEWHAVLDGLFQILANGVHRFEGTVNQYTGDGIMALFGAPLAHEDHAQRACFAALHLQDALRRHADELRLRRGLDVSVRMGLHSGEVVVGKIGDDLRMDYTAQGAVVGIAARLQALAGADRAVLSAATAERVRGYFALRDLGEAQLKGVPEPLRVFELEGRGELRTRFDLSRARGLSKFVGRARELAVLEGALERALTGQGQVVTVVAEAGTGKSRLCFEFLERCRARGLAVRTATGVSHGKAAPLLPVLEFYRQSFGIEERDDARTARQKIAGGLVRLDEALLPSLPLLDDFLGVADPAQKIEPPPGPERQRALLALLKRATFARSQREPAVILFEDLHWIDPATETFVENLVDAVDGSRTLLVANYRPEYAATWTARSYVQQIALAPLDARAFVELLGELLGPDASLRGLAERIHARTAGNPFFAEELVHELVESGALAGAPGAHRLVRELPERVLPATVQAVLAARIDRLPEREKGVLQAASVIGREFAESLLARVARLAGDALADALRGLVRAELLLEAALYPEPSYSFKHPLTQEVAYGSQLREPRARVHARVAEALASPESGSLDERAAVLAYHHEGAGDLDAAAHWHRRAAFWLEGRDRHAARAHFERVVEITATRSSPEAARQRLEAIAKLIELGHFLGLAPERARELYRLGSDLSAEVGEPALQALLVTSYARILTFGGDPELAAELASETLRLAEHVSDPVLQAEAVLAASFSFLFLGGGPAQSLEIFDRMIAPRVPGLGGEPGLLARFHGMRGRVLIELGRLGEAAEEVERAFALTRSTSNPNSLLFVDAVRAFLLRSRGDGATLEHCTRLVARCDEREDHFGRVQNRFALAEQLIARGRGDDAAPLVAEALAIARERSASLSLVEGLEALRARVCLEQGDVARAAEIAESVATDRFYNLVRLRLVRARIAIARDAHGERERIEALLDGVARDVESRSARIWLPEPYEIRALLARALGDEAGWARELREAQRLHAEMGATGHVARLAAQLAAEGRLAVESK